MDERFGFIRDKLDIKILVLYIMRRLSEPITTEKLAELALCDGAIGYFDYAECVSELESTEHIFKTDRGYVITEKGRINGEVTENSLPHPVRINADRVIGEYRAALKRSSMITASASPRARGGTTVHLSVSDGMSSLMDLDILVPGDDQALRIQKNFRGNAEEIYLKILELLSQK